MPKQEFTWASVPNGYALCIHSDCSQAKTCLRAIAFALLPDDVRIATMVNPSRCNKGETCQEHKNCEPLRYALGFTHMQQELLPRQYDQFMSALIGKFGRNEYFRRRRGERPMPPAEQALVRKVLQTVGAPDDLDFDAFEERIPWYD